MEPTIDEIELQRRYYAETAAQYDSMHVHAGESHFFALELLAAQIRFNGAKSVLEIGSGTGRAVRFLKERFPHMRVLGVEPVAALRELAYSKGILASEIVDGDATALAYADEEFDIVCEFGVLHHIRDVDKAVAEMCRVARATPFPRATGSPTAIPCSTA